MSAPVACQLGVFSAEERRLYQAERERVEAGLTRIEEVENGYVLDLPGDDETLTQVAAWIALERRCCPFFEFTVAIGGADGPIRVALTGSAEVKQFLATELGERVVAPTRLVRKPEVPKVGE
jgi:hypothetical protein